MVVVIRGSLGITAVQIEKDRYTKTHTEEISGCGRVVLSGIGITGMGA
jgi:hypothetical protein